MRYLHETALHVCNPFRCRCGVGGFGNSRQLDAVVAAPLSRIISRITVIERFGDLESNQREWKLYKAYLLFGYY